MQTALKYEINFRNYILVVEGSVKIKLAPPKSAKYLYPVNDYENLEFSSPINPWQVQGKYRADFDKVKCLDIVMKKGQILFLPAYWWYSIEFTKETSICTFNYKTYMNTVAILPQLVMKLLQTQNVKRNNVKQLEDKHNVEENDTTPDASSTSTTLEPIGTTSIDTIDQRLTETTVL